MLIGFGFVEVTCVVVTCCFVFSCFTCFRVCGLCLTAFQVIIGRFAFFSSLGV